MCSRRNLETVVATSLQIAVDPSVCEYESETLTIGLKAAAIIGHAEALLIFLQTYVINMCLALFYIRQPSNELVKLTSSDNRLVQIVAIFGKDDADTSAEMSNRREIFDHNSSDPSVQIKRWVDKKVRLALSISAISRPQFEAINEALSGKLALKVAPGKTSDISAKTQRNWSEPWHVVATTFYCFIDTMLTAMLENNIKMVMNMFKAEHVEILPGVLIYLPSGKQVLPKTMKALVKETMTFNMKTPLQCYILFNESLKVQGVERSALGAAEKRVPIYIEPGQGVSPTQVCFEDFFNVDAMCAKLPKKITSELSEDGKIVKMRAHTTAEDIMEWKDKWCLDEFPLGLMGENRLDEASARRTFQTIEKSAPSPTKKVKSQGNLKLARVTKLDFTKS